MKTDRRNFMKRAGLFTAAACAGAVKADVSKDSLSACEGPADYTTDVLVVGGGPAGVCAAIAAARNGAKTLVVEKSSMLGGMATQGLVGPFMTCYDKAGEKMIIRGLFEEIVERLVARGGALHPKGVFGNGPYSAWIAKGHDHVTPFDPEELKVLLDEMCAEAGVKVLFHTMFLEPIVKDNRASGARVFGKGGPKRIAAKIVIDATGDGDYAYRAGVPCTLGDGNGRLMPATMFFHVCNIDSKRLIADIEKNKHTFHKKDGVSYRGFHWYVTKAIEAGEWDLPRRCLNMYRGVGPDVWLVNNGRIPGVDATDSESLSKAEVEGRRQTKVMMDFLRKYVPGCENIVLMGTGSTVGIRETRHVAGEAILKVDDVMNGVVPEDSVFLAANSVDVHGGKNNPMVSSYKTINANWYGVSYRCLVAKGVENLLLAGRCLSGEPAAAGAVRVMPPCMAMGQAAGTAAALALKSGTTPRALDTKKLIARLRQQKAFLAS
jgi:hypothetical protein